MILQIYSVYDQKAEAYLRPWFAQTDGVARRIIQNVVTDHDHEFARHPDDFTLFRIGVFDENTGEISHQDPLSLGNLIHFKREVKNDAPSSNQSA